MAEKMTQKEMFAHIAEALAGDAQVVEFCEKKIAQLSKPRKPRVNSEAIAFAEDVYATLKEAEVPATNMELAQSFEVSSQKMAAALRRLVEEGKVIRQEGEKAKDKPVYLCA